MQIKSDAPRVWVVPLMQTALTGKLWRRAGVLMVLCAGVFAAGVWSHRSGAIQSSAYHLLDAATHPARTYRTARSDPEHFTIDVAHLDYQKLAYHRQNTFATGHLVTTDDSWVPARIRYRNKSVKVRMRLKGDLVDHLLDRKWSFRIKVGGENTLFGMRKFSIQKPSTRNGIYEWLFHHTARRDGLIGLRYDFVSVTLNGNRLGVYALEEHFDKRLIEFNQRREGPILKFDEALWWDERAHFGKYNVRLREDAAIYDMERELPGFGTYFAMPLVTFEPGRVRETPALFEQYQIGLNLLEGFRCGRYDTREVFDLEQMAAYLALCDLFGTNHSMVPNQVRLYYNPITARLEPIAYDLNAGFKLKTLLCALRHDDFIRANGEGKVTFIQRLLADELFFEAYVHHLDRVSQKAFLDDVLDAFHEDLQRKLAIIRIDDPDYEFAPEVLYKNGRYIRMMLDPIRGMDGYLREASADWITLELAATQSLPVEVLSLELNESTSAEPAARTVLQPKVRKEPSRYQTVRFELPAQLAGTPVEVGQMVVRYRMLGTKAHRSVGVYPWPHEGDANAARMGVRHPATVDRFTFVVRDEAAGTFHIQPGDWTLAEDLVIPEGYRVICPGGTRLNLRDGAAIISRSPLMFGGTAERPIVIESADGTGRGVVVLAAGGRSVLHHVRFNNLANPTNGAWELTGAVTFYESPVELIGCALANNRCEDGLNVVRSEFIIERCAFHGSESDALDVDFGNGRIIDSVFLESGNDAVDVSGSDVQLVNVKIAGAGDKGLSAGENSHVDVRGVDISNTGIGVASKDLSVINGDEIAIRDASYGFAAYQKKPEFGPAEIQVRQVKYTRVRTPHTIERGSVVVINDRRLEADNQDLYERLYGDDGGRQSGQ